jgi:DNA polymerase I-like protein with 3'-5' exonuclease and polymerase domains
MIELTTEQQELLTALRAALASVELVFEHEPGIDVIDRLAECVIDCEWDEDTGALERIGVGNPERYVGVLWTDLDDYRRVEVKSAIERLTRRAHVIYHSAISDIKKLRQNGFDVHPATHADLDDTMLAHAVLRSEEEHTLDYLNRECGKLPPGYKALKKIAPQEYNVGDVVETWNVWTYWVLPEFAKDPAAERIYREQSLAYLKEIQVEQEEAGIRVDKKVPYVLRDRYAAKREQASRLARAYVGGVDFNLNSPDDLKHFLYVVEALPEQREKAFRGELGKLTTDKDAIADLRRLQGTEWDPEDEPTLALAWENIEAGGHPLLEARYLFAGAQQALSHYVMPCFEVDSKKGLVLGIRDRIFPECRIHVQSSGRHSYVGPALQQLKGPQEPYPLSSSGKLPVLQTLILPDLGTCWVGHDWSNIETWVLGGLANDPVILEAKAKAWDTHVVNYCDFTGTEYPPILTKRLHEAAECEYWRRLLKWQGEDDTRRTFSKRFVYRLHYRGLPENAGDIPGARTLGFSTAKLVRASELYLARHPALVEYWARLEQQAERARVIYTFMGRPRRLGNPNANARNREGSNQPMQGAVADIYITTALLVKRAAPWARLVFGSHDSQWWQTPVERREEFRALYKPIVERLFRLRRDVEMSFPASYKEREAA